MKKIVAKIMLVILTLSVCVVGFAGCTKRSEQLKIFNWGEYMDEDVRDGFAAWYKEKYNKKVKLVYREFESNEIVYNKVKNSKEDWDLVCPSDYMIEKMIKEELLLPINKDYLDIAEDENVNTDLVAIAETFDPGLNYTMPYMWGTMGIMYDADYINTPEKKAKMNSWEALWDSSFSGQIYMKDQERDSYAIGSVYANRVDLAAASNDFGNYDAPDYKTLLKNIFTKYDTATFGFDPIAKTEAALINQKSMLYKYESDDGKTEMAEGNGGKLGLYWSCDAGYAMSIGEKQSKKLWYTVPKEGSNVWLDGWVIPKYAKNQDAANAFLEYLYEYENSMLNAQYAGAQTVNKKAMDDWKQELIEDEDEFFTGETWKQMYLDMLFTPPQVLKRCEIMGDFGASAAAIATMWTDVKMAT